MRIDGSLASACDGVASAINEILAGGGAVAHLLERSWIDVGGTLVRRSGLRWVGQELYRGTSEISPHFLRCLAPQLIKLYWFLISLIK